jgi:protein subunit release factor B
MLEIKPRIIIDNLKKETKLIYYKSSGPGGQRKNKKETAVKLYHIPTGIKVIATEFRSQAENRKLAFNRLKKRLTELYKRKKRRIPTSMPQQIKEEILRRKKMHSEKKKIRRKVKIPLEY